MNKRCCDNALDRYKSYFCYKHHDELYGEFFGPNFNSQSPLLAFSVLLSVPARILPEMILLLRFCMIGYLHYILMRQLLQQAAVDLCVLRLFVLHLAPMSKDVYLIPDLIDNLLSNCAEVGSIQRPKGIWIQSSFIPSLGCRINPLPSIPFKYCSICLRAFLCDCLGTIV